MVYYLVITKHCKHWLYKDDGNLIYVLNYSFFTYSMSRHTVSNYSVVISHSSALINRIKCVENSSRAPVITLDFYSRVKVRV